MAKSIQMYGIKNCDTVRKAIKWLAEREIDCEFNDLKKIQLSDQIIIEWLKDVEKDKLINKRGLTWRKIPAEDKLLSDQQSIINLIQENPTIVKRPVIFNGVHWSVGFKDDAWDSLFL